MRSMKHILTWPYIATWYTMLVQFKNGYIKRHRLFLIKVTSHVSAGVHDLDLDHERGKQEQTMRPHTYGKLMRVVSIRESVDDGLWVHSGRFERENGLDL